MNTKEIIKYLKTTISEKGNYCYSLSKETTKAIVKHIEQQDKKIERLNNIINEINSIIDYWGYDKEQNDISSFRMAMKSIKDILGSDKK